MLELIKNIAKVTAGNSAPEKEVFSDTGIPFIRAGSLEFLVRGVSINECEKVDKSTANEKRLKLFPKGSILFAKSGMSAKMGRIYVLPVDAYVVSHLAVISITNENVNNNYVAYYFNYRPLVNLIKDDAYPSISIADIENVEIPLPKLETQNKIVAILDKAKAILDKREQTIKKYDELLRATFLDMFGDPVLNPKHFQIKNLPEFYINPKDGTKCGPFGSALRLYEYTDKGVPVWNMDNISKNTMEFIPEPNLYISEEKYEELKKYAVYNDDIIISRAGTVGKMCIVNSQYNKSIISTNIIRLRLDKQKLLPVYFIHLMKFASKGLVRLKKGAEDAFGHMSTGVLDNIEIPYPPIEIQNEYLKKYNALNELYGNYMKFSSISDSLIKSISQKAFKGELDFNTAVDLEVLLENNYDFFKENSNSNSIRLLLGRLNTDELNENKFNEQQAYDKAKSFVFELIKEGKVKQEFDDKTKKIKLTV